MHQKDTHAHLEDDAAPNEALALLVFQVRMVTYIKGFSLLASRSRLHLTMSDDTPKLIPSFLLLSLSLYMIKRAYSKVKTFSI